MEDIFITELQINKVRHLENITIPLDKKQRKHLIITSKNGSGKTSVLNELKEYYQAFLIALANQKAYGLDKLLAFEPKDFFYQLNKDAKIEFKISSESKDLIQLIDNQCFIFAHFSAKRTFNPAKSETVEKIEIPLNTNLETKLNDIFLKYLVKLEFDRLYWHKNQNTEITNQIDTWFNNLKNLLKEIFGDETLELKFDIDTYNYQIFVQGREPFDLNTLSDGYGAILDIVSEIMLRMENSKSQLFDIQGIELIDEIEAHLHIELQEKILPFLTRIFPKIQFIVSTHSPVILASLEDVVIYDLENKVLTSDLFGLSYGSTAKEYFKMKSDFSVLMQKKMANYENLTQLESLTDEQADALGELDMELSHLSPLLSTDMFLRFRNARKRLLAEKND
ncbi:MAG: ATP-binding protein [Microscillaceae bacterium]|jgi:predicted ATP-binding protein involved in virulence|nr:ATP-binding protein [Microscillaceae bacterium]